MRFWDMKRPIRKQDVMANQKYTWNDDQPIYRQITDIIVRRIIDGTYPEGELLPSVRQCAEEFDVSPLTAAKIFRELDRKDLTIKRRGIGAEVGPGSRADLLKQQQDKFIADEWPKILDHITRLGIDFDTLEKPSDSA